MYNEARRKRSAESKIMSFFKKQDIQLKTPAGKKCQADKVNEKKVCF